MSSSNKKKKIIIISSIFLIVIVAVSATLFAVFAGKKHNSSDSDNNVNINSGPPTSNYEYFTNTYNDSILNRELTTANYNGTYVLDRVLDVSFNTYSEDNKGGLTQANINQLYQNYKVNDLNGFRKVLLDKRKEKGDIFNLTISLKQNGDLNKYGTFSATSSTKAYKYSVGKFYGDDNLALIVMDSLDQNNFFISSSETSLFISLNYGSKVDATNVSDDTESRENSIYVFENIYSKNNKNLRLFTVTYIFKLQVKLPTIPNEDLIF